MSTPLRAVAPRIPIDYEAVIVSLEEDLAQLTERVAALECVAKRLSGDIHE